jgi:hypothetical protein
VCGSPANVQRTVSPSFTVLVSGWNVKLTDATVTVAALTEPTATSNSAPTPMTRRGRRYGAPPAAGRAIDGHTSPQRFVDLLNGI